MEYLESKACVDDKLLIGTFLSIIILFFISYVIPVSSLFSLK